ncbi:hypothetical protein VTO42DRAFT_7092 [Malbranchea cinnamomea]
MAPLQLTAPKNRELVGGDVLAQCLRHLGVEVAFGLHGGHLDAFLMGASDVGIRLVDTRHETVAVQAAEGYAVVAQKVGVCFVTANSGFSNGVPGLATAYADRSPILCITSSAPLRDAEANVLQGFHDQVVLSKPVTKFAHRVAAVEEIPRIVAHAFRTCSAGVPGPVVVDFPIEILFSPVYPERLSWGSISSPQPYRPGPDPEAISRAWGLIKEAKRPVIVCSTGARCLLGDRKFLSFLERTKIPVFNSRKFSSPLPIDHPLRAGLASLLYALPVIGESDPDLVILLGCRTGMFLGPRSKPAIPSPDKARYIQIDLDGSEIGRSQHIDVGIVSDSRLAIAALDAEASRDPYQAPESWVRRAVGLKSLPIPHDNEPVTQEDGHMHPYHALKETFTALKPGSIISIDGGECGGWAASTVDLACPQMTVTSSGYLGFLGNGWGYALGASIADPSRTIVNVHGDGSAGFHLAELDTYARFGCKVLTVVVNNHAWGMSINGQDEVYGDRTTSRPVSQLSPLMDFAGASKALGTEARKVTRIEDIKAAVQSLTETGGPGLLELVVSKKPTWPGTLMMVGNTDDPNVIVVPYYDNVPRPIYK